MGETSLLMPEEGTLAGQFEDLRRRATKDALSGLLNRATMEQYIKDRLRAMAPGETCALFIVDLDDFKQVNDTLGHLAGDQAIRKAGQILSGLFRANDIVGRLGGDEFAAFLCGCVTEEMVRDKAAAICEQLHLALGDRTVVNLTASAGAYLAGRGQSFEGLYQAADLALYKAKKAGKNRFCLKSRDGYRDIRSEAYRPVNTIPLSGLLQEMDSAVALLELGPLLQVIYVSPSYCRIIGVDSKDFPLPAPLARLIHPDDLAALDHALREGQRQGQAVEHTHRISGDGGDTWHWWHIRATQVAYDNPHPVMLITAMDVSLFKETERRQAERIQALQAALDQTAKRLWEVDIPAGTFRTYSRTESTASWGTGAPASPTACWTGGGSTPAPPPGSETSPRSSSAAGPRALATSPSAAGTPAATAGCPPPTGSCTTRWAGPAGPWACWRSCPWASAARAAGPRTSTGCPSGWWPT